MRAASVLACQSAEAVEEAVEVSLLCSDGEGGGEEWVNTHGSAYRLSTEISNKQKRMLKKNLLL